MPAAERGAAREDQLLDRPREALRAVVVERAADLADQRPGAERQRVAHLGDRVGVPSVERVAEEAAGRLDGLRLLGGQAGAVGDRLREVAAAEPDQAGEVAAPVDRDDHVGDLGTDVADRLGLGVGRALVDDHRRGQQRPQDREGLEVDADRLEAGLPHGGDEALDHVAVGRDDDVPLAVARVVGEPQHRLRVDHRLVGRDRDLLGRLELDGRAALAIVLERRQLDGPHDHALVGDARGGRACRRTGPCARGA